MNDSVERDLKEHNLGERVQMDFFDGIYQGPAF
jgi:hypothetical protein